MSENLKEVGPHKQYVCELKYAMKWKVFFNCHFIVFCEFQTQIFILRL